MEIKMENEVVYPRIGRKTKLLGLVFFIISIVMLNEILKPPFILRENRGCFESEIKEKTTLEAAKAMPFIVGKCLSESHSFFNPFIHINWPDINKKGDE
jgi:hypothetical protein